MVNIQFQGGAVANLTMTAFTEAICKRHTRITGSKVDISTLGMVLINFFVDFYEIFVFGEAFRMFTIQGEIEWRGGADGPILLHDFLTDDVTEVKPDLVAPPARTRQHGGADFFLVNSFTKAIARQQPDLIRSSVERSGSESEMLGIPALLCRKDTAQSTQSPILRALLA